MKKKFLIVLMILVVVVSGLPLMADDVQNLRDQADEALVAVRDREGELEATRAEIDRIYQELKDLDDRLADAVDDLVYIQEALAITNQSLEQIGSELALAQEDLDRQHDAIRARLRGKQEQGTTGLLSVLFQATSLRDFLLRMEYINNIARRDQEMAERLEYAKGRVAQMYETYVWQLNSVATLEYQQQQYIRTLEGLEEEREAYFEALRADEERHIALLAFEIEQAAEMEAAWQEAYRLRQIQIAADRAERARQQRAQQARVVANLNGVFLWPVPSSFTISSGFGNRRHPTRRRYEFHTGIDIPARSGSDIVAADVGVVILSGWHGGYGNTVIIDHGNGIHTLYAHNSRNLVSVGDSVRRGQVIARIGSTGVSTGPHLHFEVRVGGQAVDPRPFLGF